MFNGVLVMMHWLAKQTTCWSFWRSQPTDTHTTFATSHTRLLTQVLLWTSMSSTKLYIVYILLPHHPPKKNTFSFHVRPTWPIKPSCRNLVVQSHPPFQNQSSFEGNLQSPGAHTYTSRGLTCCRAPNSTASVWGDILRNCAVSIGQADSTTYLNMYIYHCKYIYIYIYIYIHGAHNDICSSLGVCHTREQ